MTSWNKTKLGKHTLKVGSGITPKGGSDVYLESGVPFIRSQNVLNNKLNLSDVVYIDSAQHKKMSNSVVKSGDVLLNITGASIGRSCVVPGEIDEANVNQHVCIVRTKENELDNHYLCQFLNSAYGQKIIISFQAGGNRQGLNYEQIKSFPLELPPLDEQKKIAKILSTWDEAIVAVEKLITTKRQLKKSILQKAFSNNLPQKKLSELSLGIYDGTHTTPKYTNDGIPFLSVENITARNFTNTKFISVDEHKQLIKRCFPKRGDILMTRIGSIGDTSYVDWDFEFSIYVSLALITPDESKINSKYLYQYTKTQMFKKEILKRSLLSAIPKKINLGDISSILVPILPNDQQIFLAEQLQALDEQIDLLSQKKVLLQKQKTGLMQQLLTGKTRIS